MALTELQVLRNNYANAHRRGADPEQIEDARQALIYGKADQAITSWLTLHPKLRVRLASKLLAGVDSASGS